MLGVLAMPVLAGVAIAQDKGVGDIAPTSGWSVKAMGQNTDNAYCALSRSYDQNLVLTLGQSVSQEYSLAIDFLDSSLDVDKAYDVTLQPGPGQIRAYQMMPASARAMVIRVGFDDSFISALETSEMLKAKIEGKDYNFDMSNFVGGKKQLQDCMGELKGGTEIKTARNDVNKGFSVQKIENAPPIERPAVPAPKVEEKTIETFEATTPKKAVTISKEPEVVAPTEPVQALAKAETPRPPIVMERVSRVVEEVSEAPAIDLPDEKPIQISRVSSQVVDDAPQISKAEDDQRARAQELMKAQEEAAEKAKEAEEKLAAQKAEKLERQAQEMARQQEQQKAEAQKQKQEQERIAQEQAKQQAERAEQQRLAQEKGEQERLEKERQEAENLEIQRLAAEKEKQKQLADQKAAELSKFKQENERLSRLMDEQEQKLAEVDSTQDTAQSEIEEIRARMAELEKENRALYLEARQARAEIDKAVVNTGNEALAKMREYERKLAAAREDNIALSKQMEEMRRLQEDGSLESVSGDWDLERATKRYNEAEREIKRLGLLLEQQRVAHRQEKSELEQMLFDPAVTEREQRRRLTELELKLEAAERQLAAKGVRLADASMPAVPAPRVTSAPAQDRGGERTGFAPLPTPSENIYNRKNEDYVLASIRAEQADIDRLNEEIKKRQEEPRAPSSIPRIEDQPTSISAVPVAPAPRAPVLAQTNQPANDVLRPVQPQAQIQPSQQFVSRAPELAPARPSVAVQSSLDAQGVATKPQSAPIMSAPAPATSTSMGQAQLRDALMRAGINVDGQINARGPGQYQWTAGQLRGQAQIVPITKVGGLDAFVSSFMNLSEKACQGDFASLPAPDVAKGRAFEVACITPQSNLSSSLIFVQRGSDVIVVGHEISADDMDVAMDARDRIAEKL